MIITELEAPGLDSDLINYLSSWGLKRFTHVQRAALKAGVADAKSMVVCAPTSGGKTLVAEIAVLKALQNNKRCIYLVSHKALADQKYLDFEKRFGFDAPNPIATVGLSTGDRDEGDASPQLLVATYERPWRFCCQGKLSRTRRLLSLMNCRS